MEFKVRHASKEKNLKETVQAALRQIEEKSMNRRFMAGELKRSAFESMDLHLKEKRC